MQRSVPQHPDFKFSPKTIHHMNITRSGRIKFAPISRTIANLAAQLLGSTCALCGAQQTGILCQPCRTHHASTAVARCRRCAIAVTMGAAWCGRCVAQPPAFDASFCATDYAPPIDVLVHALKFGAQLPLAAAMAEQIIRAVTPEAVADAAVMIAVPLSSQRLAQRGFNQAHEIAKPIARALRLPLATALCVRVRDTEPQSSLPLSERRGNMRGAFSLTRRGVVDGRHVVLVDDVMTTGETLNALATTLKRYGAARITNLVFARTPER